MPFDKDRRNRIPSIQSKLRSIRGMDKDELQLFLRIGNLIDATVQAQRGLANVGDQQSRTPADGIPVPANLAVTNALDGIDINFDAVEFNNFAHYEIQIDISSVFSNPLTKKAFSNKFVVRGLDAGVFFVRVRVVDRTGKVGEFSDSESVTIGTPGFDDDADFFLPEQRAQVFNNETVSKDFSVSGGDNIFVGMGFSSMGGFREFSDEWNSGGETIRVSNAHVATLEEDDIFLEDQGRAFGGEELPDFFYTYKHAPGQGFNPFYLSGFYLEGVLAPFFYIQGPTAFVGSPSTFTMLHFFDLDTANKTGDSHWDVTHGDKWFLEDDKEDPNVSIFAAGNINWMLQAVIKY